MKIFAQLTGGRPMKRIQYAFTDKVSGERVGLYRDSFGRGWMATGRWSRFRSRCRRIDQTDAL